MNKEARNEFDVFKAVHDALEPLDDEARSRVVQSVVTLLAINAPISIGPETGIAEEDDVVAAGEAAEGASIYSDFAELHATTNPSTNAESALVAGYWLQVCQKNENFTAQSVNRELTHLGHKIINVTQALNALKSAKPQLALQLRKSGSSQQARKTYKLSQAGVTRVREMIGG